MRTDIYYWKCDNHSTSEEKKLSYFKDKYERDGLSGAVARACEKIWGKGEIRAEPLQVDGNHFAFIVTGNGGKFFFRADDGGGDDEYMLAESALMELAAEAGVPVPRLFSTDVSRSHCPLRFQIMELCPEPSLSVHLRNGELDMPATARQLGGMLRKLHTVALDGFGFVNTAKLKTSGRIVGLDSAYRDYFFRRYDEHLDYLRRQGIMTYSVAVETALQIKRCDPMLELKQGVLVHRDPALWNILGTPSRIRAIIDWDDAVAGDPADDLGVLGCFHDDDFMNTLLDGYQGAGEALNPDFISRIHLHTLRNMLWKTKLRHELGYFEKGLDFFLNVIDPGTTLKEQTLAKLHSSLEKVKETTA